MGYLIFQSEFKGLTEVLYELQYLWREISNIVVKEGESIQAFFYRGVAFISKLGVMITLIRIRELFFFFAKKEMEKTLAPPKILYKHQNNKGQVAAINIQKEHQHS